MKELLKELHMPRYREIPNIGLFLEQTVKYINTTLEPLGCMEITSSMVSNYVKKGYVKRPLKKQYDSESIAQLLFITVAKSVLSMDNIKLLLDLQTQEYPLDIAYDYFCDRLEEGVLGRFGIREADSIMNENKSEKVSQKMLASVITAASHIIYLHACFKEMQEIKASDQ